MAISNISTANQPASVRSVAATNPASAVSKERSYGDDQPAAIVTLSAQAKRLSAEQSPRTQTQTRVNQQPEQASRTQIQTRSNQTQSAVQTDKVAVAKVETSARQAAEAPVERQQDQVVERKRINTYA
jgi:hypothetical protein